MLLLAAAGRFWLPSSLLGAMGIWLMSQQNNVIPPTAKAALHYALVTPASPRYQVTDLGTLGYSAYAHAINNKGQVIGSSSRPGTAGLAYLWQSGQMQEIGTLPGHTASDANGINAQGVVVGDANDGGDMPSRYPFIWRGGKVEPLFADNRKGVAVAVNDSNQVVGSLRKPGFRYRAFLWQDGKMTDLGTLKGGSSSASGINNRGQIVGDSDFGKEEEQHAVLWENGKIRDLGTLVDGGSSSADSINDKGQVVGSVFSTKDGSHAFLWENGIMRDLSSPGPGICNALRVNITGQAVGDWWPNEGGNERSVALLWHGGSLYNLNDLIPADSAWTLQSANGINDQGQIVGYGVHNGDKNHAFLLTPVPR